MHFSLRDNIVHGETNCEGTHWFWDKETREYIEESIECSCKDCRNLVVRRDGNSHHSIVCEVQEREEADKEEPEELFCFPFKTQHSIHYKRVIYSLEKNVRYFTHNLQVIQITMVLLDLDARKIVRYHIFPYINQFSNLCNGIRQC